MKVNINYVCTLAVLLAKLLQAQSAWVVDSLQRVGMTDAAGATTSIALHAAKGEYESFQAIVHAPASSLTITSLTASNLTGPSGATILQQAFTFYREYYVNVATISGPNLGGTNLSMGPGWYPDPLIPFKDPATGQALNGTYKAVPYALAGNHNQPFWIDINVPRTAVAGHYYGTVTVTTSLGTFTLPITLQVWNFSLPTAPRLKASFGFGGNTTVAENEVLLQHRISPFIIVASQVSTLKPYGAEIRAFLLQPVQRLYHRDSAILVNGGRGSGAVRWICNVPLPHGRGQRLPESCTKPTKVGAACARCRNQNAVDGCPAGSPDG